MEEVIEVKQREFWKGGISSRFLVEDCMRYVSCYAFLDRKIMISSALENHPYL